MKNNTLLIFIKNPQKGKVKTRLAQTVGDDEALRIYLELLNYTRTLATQISANRHIYYSHFIDNEDRWITPTFEKHLQQGQDLGLRMSKAFELAFQNSNKVVIIGSDCATLTTTIIEDAFKALDDKDFVIGPAQDGGYYLLGMAQFMPFVFDSVEWSTESVFPKTIENIQNHQKTYTLLPTLSDIDYEEDWKKYGW